MIFAAICPTCVQRFEIRVALEEKSLLEQLTADDIRRCPMGCGGDLSIGSLEEIGNAVAGKKLVEPIQLTGTQFYQALNGLPLPSQVPASAEAVEALLRSHGVVGVKTEVLGDRIYLHELTLSNGITLHLCAGGRGAQVLKITRAA